MVAEGGLAPLLGGGALVADVAQDQAVGRGMRVVAEGFAVRQRRDQGVAPELAAVGAQAQAFVHAPAVVVGFAQAVEQVLVRHRILGIENRIRRADDVLVETGHARDAVVPVAQAAVAVERGQRVVADAGQDGIEPGVALAQLALALHLGRHVGDHGHDARFVEFQQGQRQDLRRAGARLVVRAQVDVQAFEDHAAAGGVFLALDPQLGRDAFQRGEQIRQAAVRRQRHQELGRDRVDHDDLAVEPRLHQADRCKIQELHQGLVLGAQALHVVFESSHRRCTNT